MGRGHAGDDDGRRGSKRGQTRDGRGASGRGEGRKGQRLQRPSRTKNRRLSKGGKRCGARPAATEICEGARRGKEEKPPRRDETRPGREGLPAIGEGRGAGRGSGERSWAALNGVDFIWADEGAGARPMGDSERPRRGGKGGGGAGKMVGARPPFRFPGLWGGRFAEGRRGEPSRFFAQRKPREAIWAGHRAQRQGPGYDEGGTTATED